MNENRNFVVLFSPIFFLKNPQFTAYIILRVKFYYDYVIILFFPVCIEFIFLIYHSATW